jgi:hypothetical protein
MGPGTRSATSQRWRGALVLTALALIYVQAAGAVLLHALSSEVLAPPNLFGPRGFMAAVGIAMGSAGALIVLRREGNAIGWICLGAGMVAAINGLAEGYAFWAFLGRAQNSGVALWAAWICEWIYLLFLGAVALVSALFPDGRWRSTRWRTLILFGCAGTVISTVANMVAPRLIVFPADNPIGLPVDAGIHLAVTGAVTWAFGLVLLVAGASCAVGRFRHSRGIERQQLKWLALSAGAIAAAATTYGAITVVTGSLGGNPEGFEWVETLLIASILALPVSIAIAILNHRLYDIDVIINRTLVYGAVSLVVGVGYAAGVLGLQALLPALARDSSPAVALTTLTILAVFRPLRARIQALVDRRFYRSKYDAEKVIERFGMRLRHETDLDSLQTELLGVVESTMQPVHASLWVRFADGTDT